MALRDFARRHFLPYALLPLLVTGAAFILSFLCLYAGHRPEYMEEYSVFTLNTSRIGENILLELDQRILSMNLSNILKRSEHGLVTPQRRLAAAATTGLIALMARDIVQVADGIQSDAEEAVSDLGNQAAAARSNIESQASGLAAAAASKADSAIGAAATSIVEAVNSAYSELMAEFELRDFYSVHMMATCFGTYVYSNGTNATADQSPVPLLANVTLHQDVETCSQHSFLNPVRVVRLMYQIGIVFTGISLLLGIWGTASFSKQTAWINVLGALPAVLLIGLASAAVHGVALGAAELINFVGADIGIAGQAGRKFLLLTWATTTLLIVNLSLRTVLLFLGNRLSALRRKRDVGEKA